MTAERDAMAEFDSWWSASKYCEVSGWEQIARDAWAAARAVLAAPAQDVWTRPFNHVVPPLAAPAQGVRACPVKDIACSTPRECDERETGCRMLIRLPESVSPAQGEPPTIGANQCEHGSLRRKCEICERDDDIAALRAELHNAKVDRNTYDAAHKRQAAETLEQLARAERAEAECEKLRAALDDMFHEAKHQLSMREEFQDKTELTRLYNAAKDGK